MKNVLIQEFPGLNAFIDNISDHADLIIDNGVVAYRNANLTREQQESIMRSFGDIFGSYPNSLSEDIKHYIENHAMADKKKSVSKEEILLDWHIEHIYYKNPIVLSSWNMYNFKCNKDEGITNFVDVAELYKTFSEDWKNFLSNCNELINPISKQNLNSNTNILESIPCVQNHWITESPTLRMDLLHDEPNGIILKNNQSISDEDEKLFKKIKKHFYDQIYKNKDIRIFHEWQQGDIVFVDIFRMAHSVNGGFDPKDREFLGMWSHLRPGTI